MIRAVISDFGGVLTNPLLQSFVAYQEKAGVDFRRFGEAMLRIAERDGEHPLFELERGRVTEVEFFSRLGEELGQDLNPESFREGYFGHLRANDAMVDYMRDLCRRGLRMAILTNNVREWEPLWRAKLPELDQIFDLVVDSAFVGMRKPEPEIFELTLERLGDGIRGPECVFVDDVEVNCEAAGALGMHAVHFVDAEQAISDVETVLRTEGTESD